MLVGGDVAVDSVGSRKSAAEEGVADVSAGWGGESGEHVAADRGVGGDDSGEVGFDGDFEHVVDGFVFEVGGDFDEEGAFVVDFAESLEESSE